MNRNTRYAVYLCFDMLLGGYLWYVLSPVLFLWLILTLLVFTGIFWENSY
jgi:hypothetical protein